ncbi:MAG: gliding motility-associated C-terminal domain-containing protein [Flavobacteriales bacterium]|nr:gliding motility-associated C-terminal domain-containing protein [Flavobacteriales bacterium]
MRIFLIFCFLCSSSVTAQDYYFKTLPNTQVKSFLLMASANDKSLYVSQLNSGEYIFRQINKCGEKLWTKTIKHQNKPMYISNIETDLDGNFIIAGTLGMLNQGSTSLFILSIAMDGSINYMKSIKSSMSVNTSIPYFVMNKEGDFYLYFHHGLEHSVAKLDHNNNLVWWRSFLGLSNFGNAIATNDGGLLFTTFPSDNTGNIIPATIIKMDTNGMISWSKQYQNLGNIIQPIQLDQGYILIQSPTGPLNNNSTSIIKLDDVGNVIWVSNNLRQITPRMGIKRENGNILISGSTFWGMGLLEFNPSTEAIIRFKAFRLPNTVAPKIFRGFGLCEDKNSDILVVGIDNSKRFVGDFYLRVDSTLNLPSCISTDVQTSSTVKTNVIANPYNITAKTNSNSLLIITNEIFLDSNLNNGNVITACNYQKNRGAFKLGVDTTLCSGEVLTVGNANSSFDEYLWSTGAKTKQINITTAGSYFINVVSACDTLRDTIKVDYYPITNFSIGKDTSICKGDAIVLKTNTNLSNYLWSTMETTPQIAVNTEGLYWLETNTASCGKVWDSIVISTLPQHTRLELGQDTMICSSQQITLGDSLSDFNMFSWSTGDSTKFITVSNSGLYKVVALSQCNTLTDSIKVGLTPKLNALFTLNKKIIKTFENFKLTRNENNSGLAKWGLGNSESFIGDSLVYQYKIAGVYTITLTITSTNGCQFMSEHQISVVPSDYSIPNVFSPNNDGINDSFKPLGRDIKNYNIKVYNRWGQEISSQKQIGWNGRNKEESKVESGLYFYHITIGWTHGGSTEFNGNITLLN